MHHIEPFGVQLLHPHGVRFRLWAPDAEYVTLELDGASHSTHAMRREPGGWHALELKSARPGDRYRYRLPDGLRVPDPASRFNPDDVQGPSQVTDPLSFRWTDDSWRGRPWHEAAIYELHVGAFTPEGSFSAAQRRLPDLAALGITALELMPVAAFPGKRNWGYDGVLLFAPDSSYGTPDELKALVNAAHALGMMMVLDVVYNHFGPEGNYLANYCPQFFNSAHQTPWGSAINFDGECASTVRNFFIQNALYWIEEFHFDGLRLDAVHAIRDGSQPDIVRDIAAALHAGPGILRHVHLVLENDANAARRLARDSRGKPIEGTAQWNDDFHHATHVLTTGEKQGYYADFADAPAQHFGRALAQGFVFQGQPSPFRDGRPRGEPSSGLPPTAFISFLQSHDQIGNRALGERIHTIGDSIKISAARACLLLSPHVPMMFMGEEFSASTPFQYFCDCNADLAESVFKGRCAEFGHLAEFQTEEDLAGIPDPTAESTFNASKLDWAEREALGHRECLHEIEHLLSLRRQHIWPLLTTSNAISGAFHCENDALWVEWDLGSAPLTKLRLLANFGPLRSGTSAPAGNVVYSTGAQWESDGKLSLQTGAVLVTLE